MKVIHFSGRSAYKVNIVVSFITYFTFKEIKHLKSIPSYTEWSPNLCRYQKIRLFALRTVHPTHSLVWNGLKIHPCVKQRSQRHDLITSVTRYKHCLHLHVHWPAALSLKWDITISFHNSFTSVHSCIELHLWQTCRTTCTLLMSRSYYKNVSNELCAVWLVFYRESLSLEVFIQVFLGRWICWEITFLNKYYINIRSV